MAIVLTQTPNTSPAGAQPSAPTRDRQVDMAFLAGDLYATGGFVVTAAFAAAFPGETAVKGRCHISNAAGTIRFFQFVPGTALLVQVFEENAGTLRQVPNGTNLVAHSPVSLTVTTQ